VVPGARTRPGSAVFWRSATDARAGVLTILNSDSTLSDTSSFPLLSPSTPSVCGFIVSCVLECVCTYVYIMYYKCAKHGLQLCVFVFVCVCVCVRERERERERVKWVSVREIYKRENLCECGKAWSRWN
jgi:hypothetical protein